MPAPAQQQPQELDRLLGRVERVLGALGVEEGDRHAVVRQVPAHAREVVHDLDPLARGAGPPARPRRPSAAAASRWRPRRGSPRGVARGGAARQWRTPVARRPSNSIPSTCESVATVRFGRLRAGFRWTSAALQRRPLRWVTRTSAASSTSAAAAASRKAARHRVRVAQLRDDAGAPTRGRPCRAERRPSPALRPAVEVLRVAGEEHHRVHRRGAAQGLPAREVDAAAAEPLLRRRLGSPSRTST